MYTEVGLLVITWSWLCMEMHLLEEKGGKWRRATQTNVNYPFHQNVASWDPGST